MKCLLSSSGRLGSPGGDHPPIADPSPTERVSFFHIGMGKNGSVAKRRYICASPRSATQAQPLKQRARRYVRPRAIRRDLVNMMFASFINDPEHWLERAEQMRNLADDLDDEQAKETMLRIANDYGRLAKHAEQRAKGLLSQ